MTEIFFEFRKYRKAYLSLRLSLLPVLMVVRQVRKEEGQIVGWGYLGWVWGFEVQCSGKCKGFLGGCMSANPRPPHPPPLDISVKYVCSYIDSIMQ